MRPRRRQPEPEPVVEQPAPSYPPYRLNARQIREAVRAALIEAYKRELTRQVRSQAGDVGLNFTNVTCDLQLEWDDVHEPIIVDGQPIQWTHEEL